VGETDHRVRTAVVDRDSVGLAIHERRGREDDVRYVADLLVGTCGESR